MNFPSSPTLNQTYSLGAKTWKWNGTGWEIVTDNNLLTSDSNGNIGIGTSTTSNARLTVAHANAARADTLRLHNTNTGGYGPWLTFYGDYNGGYYFGKIGTENDGTASSMRFHTANSSGVDTERMRIAGTGGLQIGSTTGGAYKLFAYQNHATDASMFIRQDGAGPIAQFSKSGTISVEIDTNGNLGIGTTPAAWGASYHAFQVHGTALWGSTGGSGTFLTNNAYFDETNYRALITGGASQIVLNYNGEITFNKAASAAAGAVLTMSELGRFSSAGNFLVSTTSEAGFDGTNGIGIGGSSPALAFMPSSGTSWLLYNASGTQFRIYDATANQTRFSVAPTTGNVLIGTTTDDGSNNLQVSGSITTNGFTVGYLNVPQNTQNAAYTLVLADAGKHVYKSGTTAYALTIPPNSSVAFPIGTAITVINDNTGSITLTRGASVVLLMAGSSTDANRTLAANGMATLLKVGTDRWYVSGTGLT